ncbi:MAG TPA: tetratricopeptide repeat protein [Xenococcaceae cyanobacterium]
MSLNNQLPTSNNLSIAQIKQFQAYLEKAKKYQQLGEIESAIAYYQKAHSVNPKSISLYQDWGQLLLESSLWQNAIDIYRQGLEIDPNQDWFYYNLAEAAVKLEQWEDAIIAYQQALNINPNLPEIYQKLGDAFYQRASKDKQKILSDYLALIETNPQELHNYYQALELEPRNFELYFKLGKALVAQQKLDEAIVAYQTSLQIQPDFTPSQLELDKILQRNQTLEAKTTANLTPELRLQQAKQILDTINNIKLQKFLFSREKLEFIPVEKPLLSIILVLYNRAELTLSCLHSILHNSFKSLEVIIVDNNSNDYTPQLLDSIDGAKIIHNSKNCHFLLAANQASDVATGKYLLFLNNDTQILGNSLDAAVTIIDADPNIGAVGGKIILPDGTLQEAGSIIWRDGSCLGYGRGDNPEASQYMFQREVDYCSGASLLTPRNLFLELGKFDEAYQPAYYEETDYCVRLNKAGKKIIYDPKVAILHYEFASSKKQDNAIELQKRNQHIFKTKHQDWLQAQFTPDLTNILVASRKKGDRKSILFIDDRIPHPYLGSGYTRSHKILNTMSDLGYLVTFYATDVSYQEKWSKIYHDIANNVEIIQDWGLQKLKDFLETRQNFYEIVFVSRPHNMSYLNSILNQQNLIKNTNIIYDAEAVYCLRDFAYQELQNNPPTTATKQQKIREELALASHSNLIVSVSSTEKEKFIEYGYSNIEVLGHSLATFPTPKQFTERKDILFVGAIYDLQSPNADSIIWFCEAILPIIQKELDTNINLTVVGNNSVPEIKEKIAKLNNSSIKMPGKVEDLLEFYNSSRLFIAPTRFAAGIPHKVHEAAAYGLPIITTSLIAKQLEWQHEQDLLVADDVQDFAFQCMRLYQDQLLWQKLRNNALAKVESQCSPSAFTQQLKNILLQ